MSAPPAGSEVERAPRTTPAFLITAALALAAATIIAWLPPTNLLWGFQVLSFWPAPFRAGWGAACLVLIATAWWVGAPERRFPVEPPRIGEGKAALAGLLALAAAATLFHLFRSATGLMGRGTAIIIDLRQGSPPTAENWLYNAVQPALTGWFRGVRSTPTIEEAGRLSVVIGALLVAAVVVTLCLRARRTGTASAITFGALVLLQPSMQVFFGHVEASALPAAASILFFVWLDDALERGQGLILPGLALSVLLLTHALAAACLLSFSWAAIRLLRGRRPGPADWITLGVVLASAAFAFVNFSRLDPGFRYDGGPAFRDTANGLWLLAAPALLVLVSLMMSRPGRTRLKSMRILVPLVAVLPLLLFRLLVRTDLGPARDWDFFVTLWIALTAAAALAASMNSSATQHTARPLIGPAQAALLSLFFLLPWIGVQASDERSAARHLAIATSSPRFEPRVTAGYHGATGDRLVYLGETKLAARAYEEAFLEWPEPGYSWRSGLLYLNAGLLEKAAAAFRETTRQDPEDWQAWSELGNVLCGMNRFDRAEEALRRAMLLKPDAAAPRVHLARTLAYLGRSADARAVLETARPLLRPGEPIQAQFRLLDTQLPSPAG